jgi:pimeloyl-ACP methyl ester carboxylesterase
MRFALIKLLVLAGALSHFVAHSQVRNLITVPRFEDGPPIIEAAEKINTENVRLYLSHQPGEETWTAISDRNVSIKIIAKIPPNARGGVVLFPGGTAQLSMTSDDKLANSLSFFARSRDWFWTHGYATFLVDAPSDHIDMYGMTAKFRASKDFSVDLRAVTNLITSKYKGPIYALGHSNGTVAVANLARMPDLPFASYVLLGPIHTPDVVGAETITSTEYLRPVNVISHKDDSCRSTAAHGIERLFQSIRASSKTLKWVDGGKKPLHPTCGAYSAHSFFGGEEAAVSAIVKAIEN